MRAFIAGLVSALLVLSMAASCGDPVPSAEEHFSAPDAVFEDGHIAVLSADLFEADDDYGLYGGEICSFLEVEVENISEESLTVTVNYPSADGAQHRSNTECIAPGESELLLVCLGGVSVTDASADFSVLVESDPLYRHSGKWSYTADITSQEVR